MKKKHTPGPQLQADWQPGQLAGSRVVPGEEGEEVEEEEERSLNVDRDATRFNEQKIRHAEQRGSVGVHCKFVAAAKCTFEPWPVVISLCE